jgi:hypothetical protein
MPLEFTSSEGIEANTKAGEDLWILRNLLLVSLSLSARTN